MNGPIPEQVCIVWRDSAEQGPFIDGSTYSGKIIGEEVIEVGSRIPQELVNDLKRDPPGILATEISHEPTGHDAGLGHRAAPWLRFKQA